MDGDEREEAGELKGQAEAQDGEGVVGEAVAEAGAATRNGKDVTRGIALGTDRVPLEHDGPQELGELYARPEFRSRLPVVVNRQRIMRMRPIFRRWRLEFELEMDEAIWKSVGTFVTVVERAGRIGLGDARKIGYGRFSAEVAADQSRAEVLHRSNGRGKAVPAAGR